MTLYMSISSVDPCLEKLYNQLEINLYRVNLADKHKYIYLGAWGSMCLISGSSYLRLEYSLLFIHYVVTETNHCFLICDNDLRDLEPLPFYYSRYT